MKRRTFLKGTLAIAALALTQPEAVYAAIIPPVLVGDGVTDNTEAMQYLFDKGGAIYLPEGSYIIKGPIIMKSNTVLNGGNCRARMKLEDSGSMRFSKDCKNTLMIGTSISGDVEFPPMPYWGQV